MEFRILGALEVEAGDRLLDLGGRQAARRPRDARPPRGERRLDRRAHRRALGRAAARYRAEVAPGVRLPAQEGARARSDRDAVAGLPPRRHARETSTSAASSGSSRRRGTKAPDETRQRRSGARWRSGEAPPSPTLPTSRSRSGDRATRGAPARRHSKIGSTPTSRSAAAGVVAELEGSSAPIRTGAPEGPAHARALSLGTSGGCARRLPGRPIDALPASWDWSRVTTPGPRAADPLAGPIPCRARSESSYEAHRETSRRAVLGTDPSRRCGSPAGRWASRSPRRDQRRRPSSRQRTPSPSSIQRETRRPTRSARGAPDRIAIHGDDVWVLHPDRARSRT